MPRVLLVEDEEHLAAGIRFNLELDGYDVETIGDGLRAVERLAPPPEGPVWDAASTIDLVVLDVMLPGMDGYDVCKMIKKNKDNSLMKVVMLTSKDKTFDKIRGTMAGCDGYLTKPVDELKLRAIIERHTVTRK